MIQGKEINGFSFGILCKEYTEGVKRGVVSIETTFESMKKSVNATAIANAMKLFSETIQAVTLPQLSSVVQNRYNIARENAMKEFQGKVCSDKDNSYFNKLVAKLDEEFCMFVSRNNEQSLNKCRQFLEDQCKVMEGEDFHVRGGFNRLCQLIKTVEVNYRKLTEAEMGPKLGEAWKRFNDELEEKKSDILKFDNAMNEEDKKQAELKAQNDRKERENLLQREKLEEQAKQQRDMAAQYERNLESQKQTLEHQQTMHVDQLNAQFSQNKAAQEAMIGELRSQQDESNRRRDEDRRAHTEQMNQMSNKISAMQQPVVRRRRGVCCVM